MKLKKWVQGILVVILILSSITMMLTIDSDFENWGLFMVCNLMVMAGTGSLLVLYGRWE